MLNHVHYGGGGGCEVSNYVWLAHNQCSSTSPKQFFCFRRILDRNDFAIFDIEFRIGLFVQVCFSLHSLMNNFVFFSAFGFPILTLIGRHQEIWFILSLRKQRDVYIERKQRRIYKKKWNKLNKQTERVIIQSDGKVTGVQEQTQ